MKSFATPRISLGPLDADATAGLITAAADVALVLDQAGIIRDIAFSQEDLARDFDGPDTLLGRAWSETVAKDSRVKVEAMLARDPPKDAARWRHINQVTTRGATIPLLCSVAPLGDAGRHVVFARDLRPLSQLQQRMVEVQQSMERDYSRLRQAETRYRLLFQMAMDPVLILDADQQRILEANPAAQRLFGRNARRSSARTLAEMFEPADRPAVQALLASVRSAGRADDVTAHLAEGGEAMVVSASTFRQEAGLLFLVRLSALAQPAAALPDAQARMLKVVQVAPDGFVVTDASAHVLTANAAFLDMAQLAHEDQARGETLDRWIGRQGVELDVLLSNLRSRGAVRLYTTTLHGALGGQVEVEISAVSVMNEGQSCFGFQLRDIGARTRPAVRAADGATRSVEQLTELIGRVPLKDLVREATDAIERLCIEAALELTGDNRASAAEMLGLSRQSLYVKLRRYGLGDLDDQQG
ncbi:transcriptional regulator PpsR [Falsiroseomonas sp.]|uniref:transcriptional regulator PpsR n=1 Tax=Falsiroseomonas sp. TaxID=2870721 RepID=UPI002726A87F|nr:transcriptional regulator PpsR [Falsiroseomonas sp.]MDO9503176.1 transcriptional regulator PpsR [Falsiroseomonas sp.]